MSVVALVGNGLSISYNQEMSVPSLTTEILHRFESADDELGAIAAEAGHGESPGFEDLLGPFDAVSAMIRSLPGIRSGEGWSQRFEAFGVALEAARQIHSRGTGLALSVIAERSQIEGDFQPIWKPERSVTFLTHPTALPIGLTVKQSGRPITRGWETRD